MVRRLSVTGLSSFTTLETFRKHFEQFGELYECILPPPPKYEVYDYGGDDEKIDERSAIQYKPIGADGKLDDDFDVPPFDSEKFENFEEYMNKIGSGEMFTEKKAKLCAGYGFVTYVDYNGYRGCMSKKDDMVIDGVKCEVEHARPDEDASLANLQSKRLFVSFFPLPRLTAPQLKEHFGVFGKITDVEFVSDSEGPLHFCIITFSTPEAVTECLKKTIVVDDVQLFTRRAILREQVKIAEQKQREFAKLEEMRKNNPPPPQMAPVRFDPSMAAGYAPISRARLNVNLADPSLQRSDPESGYGYGPRNW